MADEYKALTVVSLPFAADGGPKVYQPGDMILSSDFDANAEGAAQVYDQQAGGQEGASPLLDADDEIDALIQAGAISEDTDAPLHPAHRPPQPGATSVSGAVAQAQALVAQLEERGDDVPPEVRALAEMETTMVSSNDTGEGA